jgi:hypothetical protein
LLHQLLERQDNRDVFLAAFGHDENVGIAPGERGELDGDAAASEARGKLEQRETQRAIRIAHSRLDATSRDPRQHIVECEDQASERRLTRDRRRIARANSPFRRRLGRRTAAQ